MAFADTDGTTLKFVEETAWGTTPANSTLWKSIRAKGWSLKPNINTVESEELSSNVDVRDVILATKNSRISINGEYSKDAAFETILEQFFRSAFATNILKGGILKTKSISWEELAVGTASEYAQVNGFRCDTLQFGGQIGQAMQWTLSGTGNALGLTATSLVGTGSVAAAGTSRILTLADATSFAIASDVTPLIVTDLSVTLQNNTREQFGAGSQNMQGVGYGTRRCTVNFTAYFETREQMAKVNANSICNLTFVLTDGTNSHTWNFPRLKYTDAEKAVGGRSTDLSQKFTGTATYDSTALSSVVVTRT